MKPRHRRIFAVALVAALALPASGCDLFGLLGTGRCAHEARQVEGAATLRPPGAATPLLVGRVMLAETRGGSADFRVLSVYLERTTSPEPAPVARIVRGVAGHADEIVFEAPLAVPVQGELVVNRDLGPDDIDSDTFRELLAQGDLTLEMRDAAGALLFAGRLEQTAETDWERPYCD